MTYDAWKTKSPDDYDPNIDPPQQWYVCDACGGEGYVTHTIVVYEPGCHFPHEDAEERTCRTCGGSGGWLDDARPDR